uniref:Uncharacterized protein n=1 Tax=Branchiostoma floridae TaxID=7739 RepID=C4A054_BRAFL|eukprot:XP_002585811.1 hypothetical protein BRAFLDRAFT_111066 [Branchiostoma floridae]
MDDQQLDRLPEHVRPRMPVTEMVLKTFVSNSVRCCIRKLVYAYEASRRVVLSWADSESIRLRRGKESGQGYRLVRKLAEQGPRRWWSRLHTHVISKGPQLQWASPNPVLQPSPEAREGKRPAGASAR